VRLRIVTQVEPGKLTDRFLMATPRFPHLRGYPELGDFSLLPKVRGFRAAGAFFLRARRAAFA